MCLAYCTLLRHFYVVVGQYVLGLWYMRSCVAVLLESMCRTAQFARCGLHCWCPVVHAPAAARNRTRRQLWQNKCCAEIYPDDPSPCTPLCQAHFASVHSFPIRPGPIKLLN